jgi:hypothetical protein
MPQLKNQEEKFIHGLLEAATFEKHTEATTWSHVVT